MKKILQEFFKSKLNIIMAILQCLAILFLCLNSVWQMAVMFMLIFEGLFFILFGIKTLQKNKIMDKQLELIGKINIENIDMERESKKNKIMKKSNMFTSFIYFMMGATLIIIAIL